jgi:hypothetical protein
MMEAAILTTANPIPMTVRITTGSHPASGDVNSAKTGVAIMPENVYARLRFATGLNPQLI